MSSVMVRMPEDLKEKLGEFQDKFREKTQYGAIERLIQTYETHMRFTQQVREERAENEARQKRDMLNVGENVKTDFEMVKAELNIKSDAELVAFLLLHYQTSQTVDKLAVTFLRGLK